MLICVANFTPELPTEKCSAKTIASGVVKNPDPVHSRVTLAENEKKDDELLIRPYSNQCIVAPRPPIGVAFAFLTKFGEEIR